MPVLKADIRTAILWALAAQAEDPSRDNELVHVSFTVHALAREINANPSRVEAELRSLKRAGIVVVRVTRANDVLYKLADANHEKWAAVAGSLAVVRAPLKILPKRSRKLGGRHIHITGWF